MPLVVSSCRQRGCEIGGKAGYSQPRGTYPLFCPAAHRFSL